MGIHAVDGHRPCHGGPSCAGEVAIKKAARRGGGGGAKQSLSRLGANLSHLTLQPNGCNPQSVE